MPYAADSPAGRDPGQVPAPPAGSPSPTRVSPRPAIGIVRPAGPAPPYRTVVGGLAKAGPTSDERVTALGLLTDGQNDNASAIGARQFRDAVARKGVRVFAVAMGATGCAAPVLKTVTTATGGTSLEADADSVAGQLDTIMKAVL